MNGLMMQWPLLISSLLVHAERHHGEQEIVSRRVEGDIHRTTFRELAARSRRMANALARPRRARAATASRRWPGTATATSSSTTRSRARARCCTRSTRACIPTRSSTSPTTPRTRSLFFDLTFLPLVEAIAPRVKTIKHFVAMTDRAHMPAASKIPSLLCYEDLVEAESDAFDWPSFDENQASSLCYTSGTTGNPKGVLYSHRSTVLHTFAIALPDALNCSAARRRSCRSCRCSTSTPGACRTPPA